MLGNHFKIVVSAESERIWTLSYRYTLAYVTGTGSLIFHETVVLRFLSLSIVPAVDFDVKDS